MFHSWVHSWIWKRQQAEHLGRGGIGRIDQPHLQLAAGPWSQADGAKGGAGFTSTLHQMEAAPANGPAARAGAAGIDARRTGSAAQPLALSFRIAFAARRAFAWRVGLHAFGRLGTAADRQILPINQVIPHG